MIFTIELIISEEAITVHKSMSKAMHSRTDPDTPSAARTTLPSQNVHEAITRECTCAIGLRQNTVNINRMPYDLNDFVSILLDHNVVDGFLARLLGNDFAGLVEHFVFIFDKLVCDGTLVALNSFGKCETEDLGTVVGPARLVVGVSDFGVGFGSRRGFNELLVGGAVGAGQGLFENLVALSHLSVAHAEGFVGAWPSANSLVFVEKNRKFQTYFEANLAGRLCA